MIHRALFGSVERFLALLIENYGGAFPAWLAPVQVEGIPMNADQEDYLDGMRDELREHDVRMEVDYSEDRFNKKIRNAAKQKVPFILIAGAREQEASAVSFRFRDGSQLNGIKRDEALGLIEKFCDTHEQVMNKEDFLRVTGFQPQEA